MEATPAGPGTQHDTSSPDSHQAVSESPNIYSESSILPESVDNAKQEPSREKARDTEDTPEAYQRKVNLGVRYYNYRGFMNRTLNNDSDYTIEVLVGRSNLCEDIEEEKKRRNIMGVGEYPNALMNGMNVNRPQMAETPEGIGENRQIHRVRIRSPEVLRHLNELTVPEGSSVSLARDDAVFYYPFHLLAVFHDKMQERLASMEAEANSEAHLNSSTAKGDGFVEYGSFDSATSNGNSLVRSPPRLDQMRCYIQFVETVVLSNHKKFDKTNQQALKKIRFEDVPLLFQPGDLIYVAPSAKTTKVLSRSAIQTVFKCAACNPPDFPTECIDGKLHGLTDGRVLVDLFCVDHDDEKYNVCWRSVRLEYFTGECDITSLACFPLRFHSNHDEILTRQINRGNLFRSLMDNGVKHQYYSGWTLVTGILEEDADSNKDEDDPEYIESEVIVDMKEAARHMSELATSERSINFSDLIINQDTMQFMISKGHRTVLHCESDNLVSREDLVYWMEGEHFIKRDGAIHDDVAFIRKDWMPEDIAILPRRILGYVLRERKFTRLDVENFQMRATKDNTTLDQIRIKEGHRMIIRSTVSSHFAKVERERIYEDSVYNPDLIRGKGRGLVILLHGAPGVGKTATAEAVAMEFGKPLFPITCGDLGTTSGAVEKSLKDIFRYAHLWNCILLLDEADVFLTQRDRTDVERNALVSVFLRVLEYYSGILFLTTNRVGALDEAFRSRVHISLYYPHLDRVDTLEILKGNLSRLPREDRLPEGATPGTRHLDVMDDDIEQFVMDEYDEYHRIHRRGPWNGRQIRNAVQIASCLAFYQNEKKHRIRPAILTADHFRKVNETITEFDQYLNEARRADDHKIAHMEGVRYDKFGTNHNVQEEQYESWNERDLLSASRRGQKLSTPRNQTPQRLNPAGRGYPSESSRRSGFPDLRNLDDSYNQYDDEEDIEMLAPIPGPRVRSSDPSTDSRLSPSGYRVKTQLRQREVDDLQGVDDNGDNTYSQVYPEAVPRLNRRSLGIMHEGIWSPEREHTGRPGSLRADTPPRQTQGVRLG